MKKTLLTVAIVAGLSTQVFAADTAFLSKAMAKMAGDIQAIKAEQVYLKQTANDAEKIGKESAVKVDKVSKNLTKEYNALNVKVDKNTAESEKLKTEMNSVKAEIEKLSKKAAALETSKEKSLNTEKSDTIKNQIKSVEDRFKSLEKRVSELEAIVNKKPEAIDPEVEKKILKYIND